LIDSRNYYFNVQCSILSTSANIPDSETYSTDAENASICWWNGAWIRKLRIIRPNHLMITAVPSSLRVRLSSLTNTQGLPSHRLIYISFAELKLAYPFLDYCTKGARKWIEIQSSKCLSE